MGSFGLGRREKHPEARLLGRETEHAKRVPCVWYVWQFESQLKAGFAGQSGAGVGPAEVSGTTHTVEGSGREDRLSVDSKLLPSVRAGEGVELICFGLPHTEMQSQCLSWSLLISR